MFLLDNSPSSRSPFRSLSTWRRLASGRVPGQVVIQFTDKCNASCAQCGMRVQNRFDRTTLDVDEVKRLLDAMAERGVAAVSFTGGEPLLCLDQVAECIRHAGSVGIPYIRTGTNGFLFRGADKPDFEQRIARLAETLAATPLGTFWISLDSADPALHEANRGLPGVVAGIEKALPLFHEHGLYPSANLGINRLTGGAGLVPEADEPFYPERFHEAFCTAFSRFYTFAETLGFTIVNACYPMSFEASEAEAGAVYAATSEDGFIRFTQQEKRVLFQALYDTVPRFRSRLRIFTPRSSLLALMRDLDRGLNLYPDGKRDGMPEGTGAASYPCRGGRDFFFVDSRDMNTYPCGYRGSENLGKFWDLDLKGLGKEPGEACRACDWECFRDPSELAGPISDLFSHPFRLSARFLRDTLYRKAWFEDLRYYRACDFFNARTAPDPARLARFA